MIMNWLMTGMDQGVNLVLKMIEQDGASLAKKAEMCKQTRPDLIDEIEKFYCLYRSLAERYDHLNVELYKSIPSEFQMQGAGNAPDTPMLTPDQKLGSLKSGRVASVSSGGSDSSSSSSDSESESFNSSGNAYYSLPISTDHKGQHQKIELGTGLPKKLKMDVEENRDGVLNVEENENYEELRSKVIRYEEELRVLKLKLQLSEEEVTELKNELAKSKHFMILAETLQAQLESADRDVKMREADLEEERRRVMALQKQAVDDKHELQGQLKLAQDEKIMLKAMLDSESNQVLDLQERIVQCVNDLSDRDDEIKALKLKVLNAGENFLIEKSHMQSKISSLSERENLLEVRLRELELQGKTMEDKLRQFQTEKMELQLLHDTHRMGLEAEISQLKAEVGDRSGHVEILNKNLDNLKFKYDMLMAEKDGMNAKVNTLVADLSSRENQIGQMEEHLRHMHMENLELIAGSESVQKLVHELRLRAAELEKEVDKQKGELSAGAEEKREAIRQLCFSLDHYRSGYKELYEAFLQQKRHAVMAS
ncbi:protein NETWORKED 4B isoform X1 [Hevea brasiliensis]|nr:protein NETWORKED 4B isoform X1 [Hevea brasiliensis]